MDSVYSQISAFEDMFDDKKLFDKAADIVCDLGERTVSIISMRFGLDGQGERSYAEIGRKYGVTGTRIRQIEGRALRAVRWSEDVRAIVRGLDGESCIERTEKIYRSFLTAEEQREKERQAELDFEREVEVMRKAEKELELSRAMRFNTWLLEHPGSVRALMDTRGITIE